MTYISKKNLSDIQNRLQKLEEQQRQVKILGATYTTYYCYDCGNPIVLNNHQIERLTNNHKTFYCASGHGNVFK